MEVIKVSDKKKNHALVAGAIAVLNGPPESTVTHRGFLEKSPSVGSNAGGDRFRKMTVTNMRDYRFGSALDYFRNEKVTVETVAGPVKGRLASSEVGGRLVILTPSPTIVNQWFKIWR